VKIIRFVYKKKICWGRLKRNVVTLLSGSPFSRIKLTQKRVPLNKIKLLVPTEPTKIILTGLNYTDHARELNMKIPNEPLIFLKPPTSVIANHQPITYPEGVRRLDYEAELAIVIGKKAKSIPIERASKYILGYTCLNDVTARDLQKKDIQWTRAKSFDSFCPIGPCIQTDLNPQNVKIASYLNGKLKQDSSTANFIFSVSCLVAFSSKIMTLLPGDVISTGTPSGVGKMKRGDRVKIEIEGIGSLSNNVI